MSLRESDLRAWSFHPDLTGMHAMQDMFCAVHAANGGHLNAAGQLVAWALANGVKREQLTASAGAWCYSTPEERRIWGTTMADRSVNGSMPEKALAMGLASKEQLQEMRDAWEVWMDADDGWFGSLHGELLIHL